MEEAVLGKDVKMGEAVFYDSEFLENVKEICVNNRINKIRREELREFLENVKTILVNKHPNEFVTIKEIVNDNAIKKILEQKWNLCNDPDYAVRWFLCHPIGRLSPYTLYLECRTHEDYAQWTLKYNPDRQGDYQETQGHDDLYRKVRQHCQEIYDLTIEVMVEDIFPDIELKEEREKCDGRLDEYEETQRILEINLMAERRGDRWR